jgi:hypothetical protein
MGAKRPREILTRADRSGAAARRETLTSEKEKDVTEGNGKVREIDLGDDLSDVVVKVNGITVMSRSLPGPVSMSIPIFLSACTGPVPIRESCPRRSTSLI